LNQTAKAFPYADAAAESEYSMRASGKPSDAAVLARIGDEIIRRTQS
jgi:hypothetical protein